MTTTSIDRTETELRAAARRRGLTMKEACGQDGRVCELPVDDCDGAQALDSEDDREGRGGAGRGPRAGNRLPPGRAS